MRTLAAVGVTADDGDELGHLVFERLRDDTLEVVGRENLGSRFALELPRVSVDLCNQRG